MHFGELRFALAAGNSPAVGFYIALCRVGEFPHLIVCDEDPLASAGEYQYAYGPV
jgi:hypothetical protein